MEAGRMRKNGALRAGDTGREAGEAGGAGEKSRET
jgi:hypothetical protein